MKGFVVAMKTAAEWIGIEKKVANIEPNKFADLLVKGAPSESVGALQDLNRIKMTMKEGTAYVTRPLQASFVFLNVLVQFMGATRLDETAVRAGSLLRPLAT